MQKEVLQKLQHWGLLHWGIFFDPTFFFRAVGSINNVWDKRPGLSYQSRAKSQENQLQSHYIFLHSYRLEIELKNFFERFNLLMHAQDVF